MWFAISRFILRYRLALLVILLSLSVLMSYEASKIKLSYDFAKVLPDDNEEYVAYQNFKKTFGEDGSVMVIGLSDPNFFEVEKFAAWHNLSQKIKALDGIEEVVSLGRIYTVNRNDSLEKFEFKALYNQAPRTQLALDSLKEAIYQLPFYQGLLYNKESSATIMAITFDKNKLNTKDRIEIVKQIKAWGEAFGAQYKLQMHYSGLPYIRTAVTEKVSKEMKLFIGLALLVTGLILLLFFRSFKAVLYSLLVVLVAVVWSVAVIVLLGYKITILMSLIPPLIIVIGIPNSIFLLNRYQSEYANHGNKIKALQRSIEKVGVTLLLANITTSIGFFVFYFTRSSILMEFGLVAAIDVMLTFFISMLLIPVVFSYLPPPKAKHIKHLESKLINNVLDKIVFIVQKKRNTLYVIVGVLVLISFFGIARIHSIGFVVDDLPRKIQYIPTLSFSKKM